MIFFIEMFHSCITNLFLEIMHGFFRKIKSLGVMDIYE